MSDIFISYSSADRPRAALVAQALAARGWSIWWDRTIPPGRQFDDVIEEALDGARCVVVLWSKASTASSWVRNEASEALRRKALIPALIDDGVKIPLEFRRLQAADLTRWSGQASTPEFEQFCDAIESEVGRGGGGGMPAPMPASPPMPAPAPAPASKPIDAPARLPPPAAAFAADVDAMQGTNRSSSPVTAASSARSKKPWLIGGGVLLLLVIAAAFSDRSDVDRVSTGGGRPMPSFTGNDGRAQDDAIGDTGIHANLEWHDYVLAYSGSVSWDGRSNTAFIKAMVADSNTRRIIGARDLSASVMRTGPTQLVLSTSVAVPGDSRTPGPHSHNVNLVFETQGNGGWQFMRNCMAPNNCY